MVLKEGLLLMTYLEEKIEYDLNEIKKSSV